MFFPFPGIKAHFQLDGDGLLNVGDVEMLVDYNKTVAQVGITNTHLYCNTVHIKLHYI